MTTITFRFNGNANRNGDSYNENDKDNNKMQKKLLKIEKKYIPCGHIQSPLGGEIVKKYSADHYIFYPQQKAYKVNKLPPMSASTYCVPGSYPTAVTGVQLSSVVAQ